MRDGDAYTKANPGKAEKYLAEVTNIPTSQILFNEMEWAFMSGLPDLSFTISNLIRDLSEAGTMLKKEEIDELMSLSVTYHNTYRSWGSRGWTTDELNRMSGNSAVPDVIDLGPGFKDLLQKGLIQLEDIEDYFRKAGVKEIRIGDKVIQL